MRGSCAVAAAAAEGAPSPMHQFEINRLSQKLEIFGFDATFTNASLFMVIAVVLFLL